MAGNNIKKLIYALIFAISAVFIFVALSHKVESWSVVSNLCCGFASAALIGFFVELSIDSAEKKRRSDVANPYLMGLHMGLNIIIGNLLWLNDRIKDDEFEWNLDLEEYFTFQRNKEVWKIYGISRIIKFRRAKKELRKIGEKCKSENYAKMDATEQERTQKMFQIVARISRICAMDLKNLEKNKSQLEVCNIISAAMAERLNIRIITAALFMEDFAEEILAYDIAINNIIEAFEIVNSILNLNLPIPVAWNGTSGSMEQDFFGGDGFM